MAWMDYLLKHFWEIFFSCFFVWIFIGDSVSNAFYAIINRPDRRRLSRKEEKALRRKVDDMQQTVTVATDILRDVEAADRAFPQLPQDTKIRVDAFLAQHLQRPVLPPATKRPKQPSS